MYYHIQEVSTETKAGHTYVLVYFWVDKASFDRRDSPLLKNDFIMQLRSTRQERVTNDDGWYKRLSDGVFVDPATLDPDLSYEWEMETVDVDVPKIIHANIERYWRRAQARGDTGNKTDTRIQRGDSDPHNILSRSDVVTLNDSGKEIA